MLPYILVWRIRPLVLLIIVLIKWRRVWRVGGMILTRDSRSNRRKTWRSAASCATNLKWTSLDSNMVLSVHLNYICQIQLLPHRERSLSLLGKPTWQCRVGTGVCCGSRTKHTEWAKCSLLELQQLVHIITTGLWKFKRCVLVILPSTPRAPAWLLPCAQSFSTKI